MITSAIALHTEYEQFGCQLHHVDATDTVAVADHFCHNTKDEIAKRDNTFCSNINTRMTGN